MEAFGELRLAGHHNEDVNDLAALVEEALKMADALGFDRVGIDLCSALERLGRMDETFRSVGQRDCE